MRTFRSAVAALAAVVTATGFTALGTQAAAGSVTAVYLKTLAGPSLAAMYPSGLVWDAHSNRLVVADTGLNRISVFQAPNWQTPVEQFGSYGTANGQFDTPRQVAVDAASNIYVADAGNSRIEAFTAGGGLRWTTPSGGTCPGCLNVAIGITYDLTNNALLVADTGHSVVKAFDPDTGNFLWSSPTGIIASPRDAIRGPDGRIWVADYGQEEVRAFDVTPTGSWSTTPAIVLGNGLAAGHGLGQLNAPYNVQFSPDGNTVYVADTGNERIARWDLAASPPVPLAPFGSPCPNVCPAPPGNAAYFQALRRVAVDPSGNIWGADFWGGGIHEFSPSGSPLTEIAGSPAPAPGFAQAFGIAVNPGNGMTYAIDRLNQRVERFDASGAYLNSAGQRGAAVGTFSWPEAVAVAPDGTVWVGDTRNGRLQHFSADLTTLLAAVGSTGSALGQFNYIEGITVDGQGTVWVADTYNNRVETYNPATGTFTAVGSPGPGIGHFARPQGIAVSASDVYVADTGNNRVQELTLGGAFVASYSGSLNQPQGVALAPDGTLWVADTMSDRLVHLTADLTDLGDSFGSAGNGNMQFFQPHSLAVYGSVLFVADTYNNRVQEFVLNAPGPTSYMNRVYLDLLGRPMDSGGAAYWVPQVQPGGGAQDARIAAAFTATTEYRYRMVDQIYLRYLGHPPDSAGQAYWSQQIANGFTYEQLRAFILSSTEYFAISGGSSTGFVANVYGEVLHRAPSAGEQAYWQGQLGAGAARSAVAYAILTSDEGYANYINRDVYQPFLRRSADQAAYSFWTPALRGGLRDEAFVANILGSAEYYAYASTH